MLYQTIIETATRHRLLLDSTEITQVVEKSGRFVFDELASRSMSQLALTRPSRVVLAKEFLQLPFDPLWIEYVDAERKKLWRERGGMIEDRLPQPIKTGLLIWRDAELPQVVHIWSAWDLPQRHESHLSEAFHFSPMSISIDLSLERADEERVQKTIDLIYENRENTFSKKSHLYLIRNEPDEVAAYARIMANTNISPCPLIGENTITHMLMNTGFVSKGAMDKILHDWREDVTQEIPFLIASLLLLNCRNGVSYERMNYEKLNKRRHQRGKEIMRDHTVIRLRVPKGAMGTGSKSYEKRSSHWVMGHPKVRKTGVFWWSPHIRGEGRGDQSPLKTRLVKG